MPRPAKSSATRSARGSGRAGADLDDIWLHVALDNPAAADRLIDRIVGRIHDLEDHPGLGPARPEISPEARLLIVGDYLVPYNVEGSDVIIVRAVHGARDLAALFDIEPFGLQGAARKGSEPLFMALRDMNRRFTLTRFLACDQTVAYAAWPNVLALLRSEEVENRNLSSSVDGMVLTGGPREMECIPIASFMAPKTRA